MNNIFKQRKVKYGSVALAFTSLVIVVVLLLNALLSVLDNSFGLYADMTSEQIYEISDETRMLLSETDEKIEIIFCRDRDKIADTFDMSKIIGLAEKYEREFDNISVRYVDYMRNANELRRIIRSTTTIFEDGDVIVRSVKGDKYRLLKSNAFFTFTENGELFGFNGEMRFTSTILSVARATDDVIVFTTGHGELMTSLAISEVLYDAGYSGDSVRTVNLKTEQIPENTKLVVIYNPKYDFAGRESEKAGSVNEIAKLNEYMQKKEGNILVLLDKDTPSLPNLSEYLSDDWGISFRSGEVITDAKNAVDTYGLELIARYNTTNDNSNFYAYSITKNILGNAQTVMSNATPLYINTDLSKTVAPVLKSSKDATVSKTGTSSAGIASGEQILMAISTDHRTSGGVEKYSHVIVSGSVEFLSDKTQYRSYANSDLVRSALSLVTKEKVPVNIETKPFENTSLKTISNDGKRDFTIALSVMAPLAVVAYGIYVYVRRLHL